MRSYQVAQFGAPLELAEREAPKPEGTQVRLRVRAAGVCHSDLHIWEGGYDLGHGKRLSLQQRGIPLPLTMGHETVGEVAAVGPDAKGVREGETRLIYPWIGCGKCPVCQAGDENLCMQPRSLGVYCDGGYADEIIVPHPRYLVDIDGLDPAEAAPYACSGLTTYSALRKFGDLIRTEPLLIIGAGGLGLMCLSLLKAMEGRGAIVVDIDPRKREAAMAAGALAAIDGKAEDALSQVVMAASRPLRCAIDLVGSPPTADLGFNALVKGGKLVIVGLFGGAAPWPLPYIPMKAATIQGSYVGNLAELRELIDLVRTKGVAPIPITRRPLAEASATLEALQRGEVVGRAVLVP
jgi:alcohol dehydrogenase/propanol-preferring alcohol dehydrogenase